MGGAEIAQEIGHTSQAYLLYWHAANILRRDRIPSIPRAIKLLTRARAIANSEAEYRHAGRIVLAEKEWELRKLHDGLCSAHGLARLQFTFSNRGLVVSLPFVRSLRESLARIGNKRCGNDLFCGPVFA